MPIKKLSLENIKKVIENDTIDTSAHVDPATAVAYADSVKSAERLEEVGSELEKKYKEIATESPEEPKVKAKNIYTDVKLTLDESIENFDPKTLSDVSDEDEYLDYDMFDFIYGIVSNDWPKPKNPLDHPIRKFEYTGEDNYVTNTNEGTTQVSTDVDGNVVIYANTAEEFNDVKAVCDYYHIKYKDVVSARSENSHWNFSLTIIVPVSADGYPMMAEDFFAQYGLSMSDVIEDHKVGKGQTANWGKTYEKNAEKDRREASKFVNDTEVEKVYDKYYRLAANSNDPLEGFIKKMFSELDSKELDYPKGKLKKRFIADFEDDFED